MQYDAVQSSLVLSNPVYPNSVQSNLIVTSSTKATYAATTNTPVI